MAVKRDNSKVVAVRLAITKMAAAREPKVVGANEVAPASRVTELRSPLLVAPAAVVPAAVVPAADEAEGVEPMRNIALV